MDGRPSRPSVGTKLPIAMVGRQTTLNPDLFCCARLGYEKRATWLDVANVAKLPEVVRSLAD
jgi:hypothetical protein